MIHDPDAARSQESKIADGCARSQRADCELPARAAGPCDSPPRLTAREALERMRAVGRAAELRYVIATDAQAAHDRCSDCDGLLCDLRALIARYRSFDEGPVCLSVTPTQVADELSAIVAKLEGK
jgi:hypothetical protein